MKNVKIVFDGGGTMEFEAVNASIRTVNKEDEEGNPQPNAGALVGCEFETKHEGLIWLDVRKISGLIAVEDE